MHIKLLLTQPVPGVGKKGDIVEVKRGFARNFLLALGFAETVSKKKIAQMAEVQEQASKVAQKKELKQEEVKSKLAKKRVSIGARAARSGRLYAAISKDDVVHAIYDTYGVELDRGMIHAEPIKSVGLHKVKVVLKDNVEVPMKVKIREQA